MEITLLNKPRFDEFAGNQKYSQFLQSWDWGDFQKNVGHRVWRLGVALDNQIIASAQIIEHLLPFNKSYLYCPRGPVIAENLSDKQKLTALKLILSKARDIAISTPQTEEIFFRLEPTHRLQPTTYPLQPTPYNLRKTKPIQPADTLILDLTLPKEQLLTNMRQKTRYNIRLAEKHGVTIKEESGFSKVWPFFEQTSKRDKFGLHPKKYYQKMVEDSDLIRMWAADYKGKIVAANIVSYFGNTATYVHGASDYQQRSMMAPFLLQWEVIKNAQEQGYKYYDFHGIAPNHNKNHPWHGITRFKKGFGGQVIHYPGTFDFIYQPLSYNIYKALRKLNLLIRKIY
ncbi:peptidoglycan bridge formation glycyltransferase FemA/FemB family protein [Patescibacteria group bacterium]|nr:peptidoglycan bridge formation glycyltransferase FemA/FemB family protein [Patescibacteria group bacterium]